MKLPMLLAAAAAVFVSGCANEGGARMGLFSATAPVIAVMSGDLFTGEAEGYANMTGKIEVQSAVNPSIRCMGHFEYSSREHGSGKMRCNDGAEASFDFKALSMLSGYGIGTSSRGPFSFAYGLTPEEAKKYLTIPANKRLESKGKALSLVEI